MPIALLDLPRRRVKYRGGMSTRDLAEKARIGFTDGGVLVGRTLVHSLVGDPGRFEEIAEFARYAQLLAGKTGLPVIEVQKVILAAWLSAIYDRQELVAPLVRDYALQDILPPPDQSPDADSPNVGWQILSLVTGYQELKREKPGIEKDLEAVRTNLRDLWATTAQRQSILSKFMLILRDEAFLYGTQAPTAKVLIVDPEEVISTQFSLPLKSHGYQVLAVGNVPDAEQVLAQELPDLILAELKMPVESGLSLCEKVKAKPETKDIPFIMLTSSQSQRTARQCLKAGAEDVVVRPVDIELLFIKLRKILEARKPAGAPAAAGVVGSLEEISLTDLVQILSAGMKSTKVVLTRNGEEGLVYLQNGDVVEAKIGDLQAEPAFFRLMTWKKGTFATQPCEQYPPRTIQVPTMSLLMEGARRSDEGVAADAPPTMEMQSASEPEV